MQRVSIADCGELKENEKLNIENADHIKIYSEVDTEEITPEDQRVEMWKIILLIPF